MKEDIDLFSESHISLVHGYFMNLYGKYWVHYMSNGFFSKEMNILTFLVLN